jgi:hypothetical protein
MKLGQKLLLSVVIGFAFVSSAGAAQDIPFSGFFGNPTVYEQLKPGPKGGAKLRWMNEGADPAKFNKYMVDSVIFFLADNADYKGIDPQEMKDLADAFNKEMVAAFKGKYAMVSDPGPDVMRIRIAITNIQPSKPGYSAITSVIPVGLGVSLVKKGATGGWSGSGQTCAEFMAINSMTNEVLVLGIDQQKAAFEKRFTKWGSATDAFKLWSEKIVELIDHSKGIKRDTGK